MKITTKVKKALALLVATSGVFTVGCELIVDFDRSRIPTDASEASVPEAGAPEAAAPSEAGTDAGPDADAADQPDADSDAGTDAGGDADAS